MNLPAVYLKKREDKRLHAGHLWVFSNEIDTQKSPLKEFQAGESVNLFSDNGRFLGCGYINPNSLITVRKYSEKKNKPLNADMLRGRLQSALALRQSLYEAPYYRLLFSEGDYVPGLIIDRFNDCFVLQLNTAGVANLEEDIISIVNDSFDPEVIVLRNDSHSRQLENLEQEVKVVKGSDSNLVYCEENGARFQIDVVAGQKTGWFYDQRQNRKNLLQYAENKTVLDVFSYTGSWSVSLAKRGARSVTAIDASRAALDSLVANAELNEVEDKIQTICDDAFDALRELNQQDSLFDIVLVDPPAFIKRKKDLKEGMQAYQRINELAMKLIKPGGVFVSSSCSYHMSQKNLQSTLLKSSRRLKRSLQILHYGGQGPDHPIHPAIDETQYLKTLFTRLG